MKTALFTVLISLFCMGLGGCQTAAPRFLGIGTEVVATGDWSDVEPAVQVAASQVEMAILQTQDPNKDDTERTFRLRTATDEPVFLSIRRNFAGKADVPETIRMHARVGRFGDGAREGPLLKALKKRLEQLAGVDYAPVR